MTRCPSLTAHCPLPGPAECAERLNSNAPLMLLPPLIADSDASQAYSNASVADHFDFDADLLILMPIPLILMLTPLILMPILLLLVPIRLLLMPIFQNRGWPCTALRAQYIVSLIFVRPKS